MPTLPYAISASVSRETPCRNAADADQIGPSAHRMSVWALGRVEIPPSEGPEVGCSPVGGLGSPWKQAHRTVRSSGRHADRRDKRLDSHDVYHPYEVVSEHVQGQLGGDLRQPLHQASRPPHLERGEGMPDGLTTLGHRSGIVVKATLCGFDHVLVLPSRNSPPRSGRILGSDRAAITRRCPIAVQHRVQRTRGQLLACGTATSIFGREIDKILLDKEALRLRARRLRQVTLGPPALCECAS